jgi:UDP-N-acetylmuramyl pentapeptide phosphotransferase/UDP-N-acetylglucosamine-1-phosphate transferase
MNNIAVYFSVFVLSFVLTYFVRIWAIRKSIIDHPNDRSSHTIPTPRGGGIAIAISWFLGLAYFYCTNRIDSALFFALLAGVLLTIVGFLDDVLNLNPGIRFLIQFICAVLGLYFLSGMQFLDLGFVSINNAYVLTPIAAIAIVWLINLFNFLDGIDGYISTEVIFVGLSIFVLFNDNVGLLLAVVTLGFLFWNWQKAKIFMGDVSSTLLGYNVAIFAIYYQNQNKASIIIWLILTSVFWFDATITLFRRIRNKENLGQAHRKHAFQRIVQAGFSHQKTVLWALLLNIIGLGFVFLSLSFPKLSTLFLLLDIGLLFMVLKYIDKKKPFEYNYHIDS